MLVIRLKRIGKKHQPTYRVVVAEHSNAPSGAFVSDLGFYNPHTKTFTVNKDEVVKWMNNGAKPSNTIARLLEKDKVKHKSVVVKQYTKKPKKSQEEGNPPAGGKPVAAAPAENTDAPEAEVAETPEASVAPEAVSAPEAETEKAEEAVEETPATDEKSDEPTPEA